MRRLLYLLPLLALPVAAADFSVPEFMAAHGLEPVAIETLDDRQHFHEPWYVSLEAGRLVLRREGEPPNRLTHETAGLRYVATNNGEWGGSLAVIRNGESRELMAGNIIHLQPLQGALYVIEGLAHLGLRTGSVWVIPDLQNPTVAEKVTLLPDTPQLAWLDAPEQGTARIVIVGLRGVMALNEYGQLEILHWDAFWEHRFPPTGLVRYRDRYFMGVPHGVVVIPVSPGTGGVRFYADGVLRSELR